MLWTKISKAEHVHFVKILKITDTKSELKDSFQCKIKTMQPHFVRLKTINGNNMFYMKISNDTHEREKKNSDWLLTLFNCHIFTYFCFSSFVIGEWIEAWRLTEW